MPKKLVYIFIFLSVLAYAGIAYFIPREEIFSLWALCFFLFVMYAYFLNFTDKQKEFRFYLLSGVFFRLVFLFGIPLLSNDYFRFIWDGRLFVNGFNPYLSLPAEFINSPEVEQIAQHQELYDGMGGLSQQNYTCYPPINQLMFAIGAYFIKENILANIITMKILIILSEIGSFYFGMRILQKLKLPLTNILIYVLNPFIIMELTGNVHWEPVMIFLVILSIFLLMEEQWKSSAFFMAMAISVKLIPLILLPALLRKLGFKKAVLYYSVTIFFFLLFYMPFFDWEAPENMLKSVSLYFDNFEFNASIFYVIREWGYQVYGYNIIRTAGPWMSLAAFIFILIISFQKATATWKGVLNAMLFALSTYYFLATTVHPWYISTLLMLSVFGNYRYVVVWSAVIMLSYMAYSNEAFKENLYLVALEYTCVYGFLIYEIFFRKAASKIEVHDKKYYNIITESP